jgi:hypothetical protein
LWEGWGGEPSVVSALDFGQCLANTLENSLGVVEDLGVPEPKHAKPLAAQTLIPSVIAGGFDAMLPTIHLHDEALGEACEIDDVRADRSLATKLVPAQPTPP